MQFKHLLDLFPCQMISPYLSYAWWNGMNNKLIEVSLKSCPLSLSLIAIDPFPVSRTPVCSQHTPHSLNIIQPPQWLQWCRADHICPFSNINQWSLSFQGQIPYCGTKISSRLEPLSLTSPTSSCIILMTPLSLVSIYLHILFILPETSYQFSLLPDLCD